MSTSTFRRETPKTSTFRFFADPSHGWLEVTTAQMQAAGLRLCDFSRYSYCRDDRLYLEENCDAPRFLQAWKERFNREVIFEEHYCDGSSRIRRYASLPVRV